MKAVVIHATGGPEQLVVADLPDPVPGAGEVLIDVAYAGCNWADTQVRMGIYPHPMTYPMVLGFEVSGTVAALGPGVTGVKVGDRVATFRRRVAPMPRNASPRRRASSSCRTRSASMSVPPFPSRR